MIMMGFSYKKQCQTVREKICPSYHEAECHYQPREQDREPERTGTSIDEH